jgi:nucleolin
MPLQDDGRSSGTAILEFETEEASAKAIALNGEDFQGRWLSIKESTPKAMMIETRKPSEKPEGCKTIFVGNLAWDVDEDTLRQVFGDCGTITSVRFAMDRETRRIQRIWSH